MQFLQPKENETIDTKSKETNSIWLNLKFM